MKGKGTSLEKYPVVTQNYDKDHLESQRNFTEQEISLEDRDKGINKTLCLSCKELTDEWTGMLTTQRILRTHRTKIHSLFSLVVGLTVHKSNYKIQHQVKCVESPNGIVDTPWDLRDSRWLTDQ